MDYAGLVSYYATHPVNAITLTARFGEEMAIEDKVLLHKLQKHWANDNRRSMARYLAGYMSDYPDNKLPKTAAVLAGKAGLVKSPQYGVGYMHADGTHHFFEVRGKDEPMDKGLRIAFIPHTTMDAYLHIREAATLESLKKATGASHAEWHRANQGCDCAPCKQFHHVVLTNPEMTLDNIRSKYGNSFAQGDYAWVL